MTRVGVAAIASLLAAACASSPSDLPEIADLEPRDTECAAVTVAVFGEAVDAAAVVATVGDEEVKAADVAAYLRLFPALTATQAVQDLIDIAAGASLPESDARVARLDAAIRGRALAWLRRHILEDPAVSTPDPARVSELLTDPDEATKIARPALVVASHVLFECAPAEQTPQRQSQVDEIARRVRGRLDGLGRPVRGYDLAAAAFSVAPASDPLMAGLERNADLALRFPRRYAGPATWLGLPAVVDAFGDAAFDAEPGVVVGPVQTEFGWHLIVVESKEPAEALTDAERRARAEASVVRHQRSQALARAIRAHTEAASVVGYEDSLRLLMMSPEERAEVESEERSNRFR